MSKKRPDLAGRNRKALSRHHPEALESLDAIGTPVTSLVKRDGVVENIDLGNGELHPIPAIDWAETQLDAFRKDPEQIVFSNPNHCNLSPVSLKLLVELTDYLEAEGMQDDVRSTPVVDVGYLFVFGIGLGYHIPILIEETTARHVVLIEPIAEFALHSLSAIDWEAVFERATERGIEIHFILETRPDEIVAEIEEVLYSGGITFLDGSYYCPHYYSWTLKETFLLLQERLKHFYISFGFFEDELEMIKNCYVNMRDHSFRLIEGKPHLRQDFPIFIIGSGPSLDRDLPHIRKWRENAILMSCGTALRILLKNDIRPDLHVENERVRIVPEILGDCRRDFGLDGITLIATTTANPQIAGLFDKRWYFFRDALSPTDIFDTGTDSVKNADPLVTNAGFSIATLLGFQNVYFFGVDCGQKEVGLHHSKDAIYYQKKHVHLDEQYRKRPDRVLPGNFGGEVKSFWAYDLGRRMLGEVQAKRRVNLYNCSDGAAIAGATPRIGAAVDLSEFPPDHARILDRLERQIRHFEPGEIMSQFDIPKHIQGCERIKRDFPAFIDAVKEEDEGFWDIEKRLQKFRFERLEDCKGFFSLTYASMCSMVRLGAFFGNRFEDEDQRKTFMCRFADAYRGRVEEMADTAIEVLTAVVEDNVDLTYDYAKFDYSILSPEQRPGT